MKNKFFVFLIFFWFLIFVNTVGAVVKNHQGTGDLYLSDKLINEYYNYINQKNNKLPLVFFITEDKKNSYFSIINNDGGGWAGSATILKKKNKCEKEFNQKCNLFSNVRYIVWDNGINPLKETDSKINSKTSKEELILTLKRLGFIIDQNKLIEKKAAKEKKLAEEKAAKEKKLAEEKAAKEKKLAEEKAAKEKKLAEEKAAKEKKLAEEKAAKEKKLAEEKAAKEKLEKQLSLIPAETELEKAQNFLNNLQAFIKLYPDEFDIVEVSEFFLLLKPILEGTLNFKLSEDLKLLDNFVKNSEKFVKYKEQITINKNKQKIEKIDKIYADLNSNVKIIKEFIINNPNSINLKLWLSNIKDTNEALDNPRSYEELLSINDNLKKIINRKNELDIAIKEAKYTINTLKDYLKVNLTNNLTPLLIEQVKLLETAIQKEITKNITSTNRSAKDFIFNKIEEPKRLEEEKIAEEKRLAEEKKRQEYLKSPEGQKEEKERIKKEKERLAEEKRLKNFKPISMTCTYSGQGGIKTYKWVFDGKNINWEGMNLKVGGEIDDGMGTTISTKKLEGRDNFQIDAVMGFIPLTLTVNFVDRSSVMNTMGISIYGTCY
jgi:hypothetical protein